jgi:hypothetical protein
MDSTEPLKSIAGMLVTLADEAVEPLLVTFDALVDASDSSCRSEAAALLRARANDVGASRAERPRAAADAVEAGHPAALTGDGLTWREAALDAGKIPVEEWQARAAAMSAEEQRTARAQYPPAEPVIPDQAPRRLPRLRVKHFFRGLVVRLRREVTDTEGRVAPAGQRLEFLSLWVEGPEDAAVYHLDFAERSFRLDADPQDDRSIIDNGGNGWFQPVPEIDCLTSLWRLVDERLQQAEDALDDQDDDYDQLNGDMLLAIRTDVDDCGNWLNGDVSGQMVQLGEPLPEPPEEPPRPECAPVAAEYFGKDSDMYAWVNLLFSAIPHCRKNDAIP